MESHVHDRGPVDLPETPAILGHRFHDQERRSHGAIRALFGNTAEIFSYVTRQFISYFLKSDPYKRNAHTLLTNLERSK